MHPRLFTCLLVPSMLQSLPAPAADYLFTNGTVLTMTERGAVEADLRVSEQRITELAPSLTPLEGDVVVDMQGGFLMPGLAEMHAHVPAPDQGERYRDDVLFLWVANGITTVRGMLGHPAHLELRRALAAHEVLGPRLITAGPSFNGASVSSPDHARQMVREQVAAGYDFLKVHPGVSRPEYDAMADEARRLGIRFAGHVPADVGLEHALAEGQATIDHLDGVVRVLTPEEIEPEGRALFGIGLAEHADLARLPSLAQRVKAAGAWIVPTQTLLENLAADAEALLERPEIAYLPPELRRQYRDILSNRDTPRAAAEAVLEVRKRIIRDLQAAGVGVLLGSDSPQIFNVPGFSIHRELAAMVAAGLSPAEALAAGTVAPARYFGREDDFGQLRPGLSADLVLLRADPTADITNIDTIQGVMVRGRWLDRNALDATLGEIRKRYEQ